MTKARDSRLVTDIAKMIGRETYNHAPVNYDIADKAIGIIHRRRVRPLERAIAKISTAHVEYEAALSRREHGGVAADRFIRAVVVVLEGL
ncbi:hypothetical protein HBE99_04435 [Mycobacteroides chelonae]|uniref:hypothetical protein n=1 Tax=Mycobacteroides chelonae TaxID=1774 RepID=UPI001910B211|nr:hypothetical protein [Mycobacteroides chelonae]QQG96193.1 hypothetical protein HBE99_04435 [Mycobacteroides chelonae]